MAAGDSPVHLLNKPDNVHLMIGWIHGDDINQTDHRKDGSKGFSRAPLIIGKGQPHVLLFARYLFPFTCLFINSNTFSQAWPVSYEPKSS